MRHYYYVIKFHQEQSEQEPAMEERYRATN